MAEFDSIDKDDWLIMCYPFSPIPTAPSSWSACSASSG
jgi:hypothetical protein